MFKLFLCNWENSLEKRQQKRKRRLEKGNLLASSTATRKTINWLGTCSIGLQNVHCKCIFLLASDSKYVLLQQ